MSARSEVVYDALYMERALELAARGMDTTDPNPRVGCVLVRAGHVVGEGWHARAGEPHAEVLALRAAGAAARGATAYVNLEPCSHFGRTPPCVQALIEAGVARVVYAIDDPNPLVSGRGAAALTQAGIEVVGGVLAGQARALNPGFFMRMQTGRPWVRVKLAASLDGRTGLAGGASRWITGEAARADVQRFRARSSVILSSSGTVLADDPALTARAPGVTRAPLRVVLDTELRVPPTARIYDAEAPSMVFTASADVARRNALRDCDVRVETAPKAETGGLQLPLVLRRLGELQANEVWVEAGARLSGALLHAKLVDELIVYLAPSLLGPQALSLVQLPPIGALADRLQLEFRQVERFGEDLRITAVPRQTALQA
jgi:diaminohydroxyphosphoribosylaminopyrimidine deaminase / 5-amino-6-(5-phosphoribosylamino)uracil reductase